MFVIPKLSVKHTSSQSQTERVHTGTMKLSVPENIRGNISYFFEEKHSIVVQILLLAYRHYCVGTIEEHVEKE